MNELTPKGQIIQGFKIVNEDLTCRDFQFQIGVWHEHEGPIKLCEFGFHFCEHPSGPWTYYDEGRMFKVEAEEVLLGTDPGADRKHVARRIMLVEEIFVGGDLNTGRQNTGHQNTGNQNTGDRNTGHRNTGHRNDGDLNTGNWNTGDQNTGRQNTGDWNAGDLNTGDRNTGDRNTGDLNTGDRNTGDWNIGNWNTGDRNTGHWNTGDLNTGHRNTGDRNTGHRNTGDLNTGHRNAGDQNTGNWNTGIGNVGDGHSGCLTFGEAHFYIFGKTVDKSQVDFSLVNKLALMLVKEKEEFDYSEFLSLPGASLEYIRILHSKHIEARKN